MGAEAGTPLGVEVAYGGRLRFPDRPRPYIVANFVSTIDGVVSLGVSDGTDSSTVGAGSAADRYLMAMLRAAAGAVVIGAGTLRATPGHQWIPAAVAGERAARFDAYRAQLHGRSEPAPLVVVTASGDLPAHVALDQPATRTVVLTTPSGRTQGACRPSTRRSPRTGRRRCAECTRDRRRTLFGLRVRCGPERGWPAAPRPADRGSRRPRTVPDGVPTHRRTGSRPSAARAGRGLGGRA